MRLRLTIRDLLWLTVVALWATTSCSRTNPEPGAKIASVAIGEYDSNGKFTPTENIPFRVGGQYGYELSVHSTSGSVQVKEVFDLPQPSTWSESGDLKPGMKVLGEETTNGGKTHIMNYEVKCDGTTIVNRKFSIVEGDPQGLYRFTIYLDGQVVEQADLQVGDNK
jgi:hypothetical protein